MYYSEMSAFDRTPISNYRMENNIPIETPVDVVENSVTSSDVWAWIAIGIVTTGLIILKRYLDSPGYSKKMSF